MVFQLLNNIKFTLAVPLSPVDVGLVVIDEDLSDASQFDPNKVLSLTLVGDEELNDYEIVYAISRTGTTFEITRGEENTTAGSWPAGTQVIAALTRGVLEGTISAPTDADQIAYGGGNFGSAGTVEETIDDMGNAIITLEADTDYYEAVQERVSGTRFSGGTADLVNLRWQGGAKSFQTAGLGVAVTTIATITEPTVAPDIVVCLRCVDVSNYGSIIVKAYNNAAPTNFLSWSIPKTAIPQNGAWHLAYGGAQDATIGGTPDTTLPDRVSVEFKDDLTGVLDVTINFIDVVVTRLSYLGAFVRVSTNAHYDKVTAIAKYGFQASLVVNIEDLPALDTIILRRFKRDGHRIYLSSTAAFRAQTQDQIMVKLYEGVREFFNIGIEPDGWVYKDGFDGPLNLDQNVTIRALVMTVYPRGVGVNVFRSAIEVYRFDDPLYATTNLADAQAKLTGADRRAINIDLSVLTAAELETLFTAIVTTANYYTTTLDYQNADNLKAGTVAAARLPVVPVSKGGTGVATLEGAMIAIGCPIGTVLPFASPTIPTGWVLCDGQLLANATYPKLYAAIGGTFGVSGSSFRVPDLRGFVVAGRDNMGTGAASRLTNIGSGMGTTGGAQNHTLTLAQLPSHNHSSITGYMSHDHTHYFSNAFGTYGGGGHSHTDQSVYYVGGEAEWRSGGALQYYPTSVTTGGGGHEHSVSVVGYTGGVQTNHYHSIPAEGSGSTHNNTQLTMVLNWIIRAL